MTVDRRVGGRGYGCDRMGLLLFTSCLLFFYFFFLFFLRLRFCDAVTLRKVVDGREPQGSFFCRGGIWLDLDQRPFS